MNADKERLYRYLNEIKSMIDDHEKEKGSYDFDVERVLIALEFTKRELKAAVNNKTG